MPLTTTQWKELMDALVNTFDQPSFMKLARELGMDWLEDNIPHSFEGVVHQTIAWAQRERWLPLLVRSARAAKPDSQELSAFAEKYPGIDTDEDARRLFICYRREDTQDAAGRLHDRLVAAFGCERVFMDIDSVPLGIDFVDHVTEQIGRCSAVIVMIGKQWRTIKDEKRRRRLDNDGDLVRAEIRAAMQRKIPVIPVTVQNAVMPQADDLPDDIRLLARRNGIELSATRWATDVERLIKELDRVMKG
jgi:hypothetical protein